MRAWLLQGRQGEDPGGLRPVLRQWAERPANAGCRLEIRSLVPELTAQVQTQRPEVLVLAAALCPARSWIEEILALEVGLVVAAEEEQTETYRDLAERHPLLFASLQPTC